MMGLSHITLIGYFIHHTHNEMDTVYFGCIPALSLDTAQSDFSENLPAVYSGCKLLVNLDMYASVFVVLFNDFMSLTSYFDMYRY